MICVRTTWCKYDVVFQPHGLGNVIVSWKCLKAPHHHEAHPWVFIAKMLILNISLNSSSQLFFSTLLHSSSQSSPLGPGHRLIEILDSPRSISHLSSRCHTCTTRPMLDSDNIVNAQIVFGSKSPMSSSSTSSLVAWLANMMNKCMSAKPWGSNFIHIPTDETKVSKQQVKVANQKSPEAES